MIIDGKCSLCGSKPERRINRSPLTRADEGGSVVVVEPRQMVDYAYYECKCGYRYTPQEMGEPRSSWQKRELGEKHNG